MVGYIVLAGIVVAVGLAYFIVSYLDRRDRQKKPRRLYDLRCSRCGNQLDFRESGSDRDGCLQLEVVPCGRCCPGTRAVKLPADWDSFFDQWQARDRDMD